MSKRDTYYIRIAKDLLEVDEAVYLAYYQMGRRERYLEERDRAHGFVSYDALDFETNAGMEQDPSLSGRCIERQLIREEVCRILHQTIKELSPTGRAMINAIYFEGLTMTQYAKRIGRSEAGISYRHRKALRKLKDLLKWHGIAHYCL